MSLDSILRATGKNLLPNPNVHAYNYSLDYKKYNNTDEIFLTAGTYSVSVSANCPTLQFWNVTTKQQYTVDEAVSAYSTNTYYKVYEGYALSRASDAVRQMWFTLKINALITLNSANTSATSQECQIEKGSTATTYEPYEYLGPKTIKMSSNSKNLIPYPYATASKTISGVTFTVQEDGGIKVEGTPNNPVSMFYVSTPANTISALKIGNTYTLSGYRSGSGATLFYNNTEVSDSYTFTCDAQNPLIGIKVVQGTTADALFYPQLEEGSVATEYELNTGSKEVLKVSYNSRNLLPYPYFHSSMPNHFGIAYTVNSDGTITANGTATGRSEFVLSANKTNWMSGNYVLSGCPSGGSKDTYFLQTINGFSDTGSGLKVNNTAELKRISIIIKQGTTVNNLVFKPQLELGNKKTDYVPYFNTVVWTK